MKVNILNYINKLQAYKTAIKNLHWASKKMSEHKLLDEIADSLADNQDEIAEIAQGIYGKIKKNQLKPRRYNISNSKKMLADLTKDTREFCDTIKGKNETGLRSVVESFLGELNKFDYLMDMCIKEDIKREYKNLIKEEKTRKKIIKITEQDIHNMVLEALKKYNYYGNSDEEKELRKYFNAKQAHDLRNFNREEAYINHGNNNVYDYKGRAAMAILNRDNYNSPYREDSDYRIALNDKGVGIGNRYRTEDNRDLQDF